MQRQPGSQGSLEGRAQQRSPWPTAFEPLEEFTAVRGLAEDGARFAAAPAAARALRARLQAEPPVMAVTSFDRFTIGYPVRFAFWGAALVPSPLVLVTHRSLLVRFRQHGEERLLLFNPTDPVGMLQAPYVERVRRRHPRVFARVFRLFEPLEAQLEGVGVRPERIDYLAFDHFHLQDLRRLLGTVDGAFSAAFPSARLIVQRREWQQWQQLHPLQQPFFIAGGADGVPEERLLWVDGDLRLGDGVMLVRTPGHTRGNQTLFLRTAKGIWGVSENGLCADNWSPQASRIPGVAARAADQGLEVLPNLDTPDSGSEQYTWMVVEKTVVDRVPRKPDFVQMYPSFEVTGALLAAGTRPTLRHGPLRIGAG